MKRTHLIIRYSAMAFAMVGMTSCLDFDNPGSEFDVGQIETPDVVYHGKPTTIQASLTATSEETLDEVISGMSTQFSQMLGGEFSLRGGKNAAYPGGHAYQRQYALGPDCYAQYATIPHHDFMYGELTSSYYINNDFNDGPSSSYIMVKNAMVPVLNHPDVDSIPELKAIALLIHDVAAQEVADIYGPFPYVEYLENKLESPFKYNTLEEVYKTIAVNIDSEIECFKKWNERPDWYQRKVRQLVYKYTKLTNDEENGVQDMGTWIRMANSLKLRMAMHIVKVEPALAKEWAEAAVAGGVVEDYTHEISLRPLMIGFTMPLCEISESWGDTRLSASFASMLISLQHPFLGYLFSKNSGDLHSQRDGSVLSKNSEYCGIREGTHVGEGQAYANNEYIGFSKLITGGDFVPNAPLYIFKLAEIEFLRAEGALRGWNMGGSASQFYEAGIRHADFADRIMEFDTGYLEEVEKYLEVESATPYTWKDPMGKEEDMESVTTIGVKWNDAESSEIKLEKIITQKYIALWPNSIEAWAELRRTGYPKVFPVLNPGDGDGSLRYGDLIRRMPWNPQDVATKDDIAATGLSALGGADQQATRLWWDVDTPNF